MNKAIFIDKDGTLIPDIPYNVDPDLITLQDNTVNGLTLFQKEGYLLIVITNQSGVAHGFFSEQQLTWVNKKINDLFEANNLHLDGFYYCPHHPAAKVEKYRLECDCRKPLPGLILQAAKAHDIDLSASWMIGDILNDVEAGTRAGCQTVLINNGNETEWKMDKYRRPTFACKDIDHAAARIYNTQVLI